MDEEHRLLRLALSHVSEMVGYGAVKQATADWLPRESFDCGTCPNRRFHSEITASPHWHGCERDERADEQLISRIFFYTPLASRHGEWPLSLLVSSVPTFGAVRTRLHWRSGQELLSRHGTCVYADM